MGTGRVRGDNIDSRSMNFPNQRGQNQNRMQLRSRSRGRQPAFGMNNNNNPVIQKNFQNNRNQFGQPFSNKVSKIYFYILNIN